MRFRKRKSINLAYLQDVLYALLEYTQIINRVGTGTAVGSLASSLNWIGSRHWS